MTVLNVIYFGELPKVVDLTDKLQYPVSVRASISLRLVEGSSWMSDLFYNLTYFCILLY